MIPILEMDVYRVNDRKGPLHRTWQVEWGDYCYWASRGYTRRGALTGATFRYRHPGADRVYCRIRYAIRWWTRGPDSTYRESYTATGAPRS